VREGSKGMPRIYDQPSINWFVARGHRFKHGTWVASGRMLPFRPPLDLTEQVFYNYVLAQQQNPLQRCSSPALPRQTLMMQSVSVIAGTNRVRLQATLIGYAHHRITHHMKRRVLITGAAGRIGSFILNQLKDSYDFVLTDIRAPAETHGFPFTQANLTDYDAMLGLCQGVETVIHLAAVISTRATWDQLLPNNIIGVHNIYQAAHEAGCRRVIFASTINVLSGYPDEKINIRVDEPIRPGNLYGASKAWGEAAGSVFADTKGLSVLCLRFGWVTPRDPDGIRQHPEMWNMTITLPDVTQLVHRCIEAPDSLKFGVFNALSNNRELKLDISTTRELLGYVPEDDAFALAGA
jgi:hypothetical protein